MSPGWLALVLVVIAAPIVLLAALSSASVEAEEWRLENARRRGPFRGYALRRLQ